jgi:hypothetical protein
MRGGGADNDPIVSIEPKPDAPKPAPRKPSRRAALVKRYRGAVIAFVVTLAALGAAYVTFIAMQSRVRLPALEVTAAVAPPQRALMAAEALLELAPDTPLAEATLLVPTARVARLDTMRRGAWAGASGFLEWLAPAPRRDTAGLVEARKLLAQGDMDGARRALAQYRERLDARKARVEDRPRVLAGLAERIAADCQDANVALSGAVEKGPRGMMARQSEAPFFFARGLAYGWAAILSAWTQDGTDLSEADRTRAAGLIQILQRAAEYQPLFLMNPSPANRFAANHFAILGLEMEAGAAAARDLANAAAAE